MVTKKKPAQPFITPRDEEIEFVKDGKIIIGIDPGPTHTGFCVIDGDVPLFAATITRPKDLIAEEFALLAQKQLLEWVNEIKQQHPHARIAIEGVVAPRSHMNNQKSFINPDYILRLGVIAGMCFGTFPDAIRVRPGHNGSGHASQYPPELSGRRNFNILPGSGTGVRDHEKSAYDVARKASYLV